MATTETTVKNSYIIFKTLADRLLALLLLILLFIIPLFPIICLLIKLESKGPIFYTQKRIGKAGKTFDMLKFRSMEVGSDKFLKEQIKKGFIDPLNFKTEVTDNYTKIGKFIRRTSIDELPQLINIIKGDMSVIGPRPIQQFEIDNYVKDSKENKSNIEKRNRVLPGLLCYWQVSSNKESMGFDERLMLDIKYVDKISLIEDFKILFSGIKVVLFPNNI
ncbi:sugar transferase [Gemella sp. GH3]|uniref:sugar transferase n=1 Tax=unclassified Gemella TaxID=2624949 RepID=UPI0015D0339B|nr:MULTISPECIES: sugar transferase [unclassified Gemella]MBF0713333.1 sugar transferase [Gemella sp. GH3.1]NYS50285.1 sugar transferase [Gemella sp. GH3]